MLDIKVIRENLDWSKKKLATRGIKPEELDEFLRRFPATSMYPRARFSLTV